MRRARLLLLPLLFSGVALAKGGVYGQTKHGDAANGVQRPGLLLPRGECANCHDEHASRDGVGNGGPFPYALFAADDAALCFTCHTGPGANLIFPGKVLFTQSLHALSPALVWPGPTPAGRSTSDAGKCINCHDPHGVKDSSGLIPSMNFVREEGLCLACHDGSPAQKDVRSDFLKPYRHPVELTGRHDESERLPAAYAGASRHSECVDCHNPHQAREDAIAPTAPDASNRLLGTSRVKVTNGAAGTTPIYTWTGADDVAFAREYELCFKCHSSFTTQPAGQSDFALLLNPANPSYHPVEAAGRNPAIDANAFVNGRTAASLVYCSDCHGSDGGNVRGPHGSSYRFILRKNYAASSLSQSMAPSDLCFDCHAYAVYGDPTSPPSVDAASRWNDHARHVGTRSITCYTCHQSHGSTLYPSLIATGRSPGISAYTQTATGGTCTPSCHRSRSYTVSYGR